MDLVSDWGWASVTFQKFGDHPIEQPGEAIKSLERAVELRDPFLMFLKVDPKWKDLRHDARFIRLLKRMNL